MKKALITGITGQDGSYLSELLLEKGYEVHGIVRRVALEDSNTRFSRINNIKDKIIIHSGDIRDIDKTYDIFKTVKPDECYHLAAQSFVQESFQNPEETREINVWGTKNVLFAAKHTNPNVRFYFAATSEMFGDVLETPQKEETPFNPVSPYARSKVEGFYLTSNAREHNQLFACSGILFNHESPRRGSEFVTRKITKAAARIRWGLENVLVLGNLDAKRDWGFSGDYVQAMWLMLQQDTPDDYVVATGENYRIGDFVSKTFGILKIPFKTVDLHHLSKEEADKEVEKYKKEKGVYILQHPSFYRPAEVNELLGDASKAKKQLGWSPKVSFDELIEMMIKNDLEQIKEYKK